MLLKKEESALILIDVQEKLAPHVLHPITLINRCQWLMELAIALSVPQFVCEQYPEGLGKTISPLNNFIFPNYHHEKVDFSCGAVPLIQTQLQELGKKQLILMGIETHVCVLQTALDLIDAGYNIFVVVDAVSSRQELDHKYGLKRMKQHGAQLVTSEMVFFEWIERAGTQEFRELSKRFFKRDNS